MPGTLYLVPTPIGNLEDITLRSLKVLREADLIACEDTRETVKLLNQYQISKPLLSFYSHNQPRRIPQIISELNAGKNIALVSDRGTPGISDPGYLLVASAVQNKVNVVPLPGANAALCALTASGLPTSGFVYLGFLKRKPGKLKKEIMQAALCGQTIIFYESPQRVARTLKVCAQIFPLNTRVAVARELTKKFEEFIRGDLETVTKIIESRKVLGELVVVIEPPKKGKKSE